MLKITHKFPLNSRLKFYIFEKNYMTPVDKNCIKFIKEHHILTLATTQNNESGCCTCFYVYMESENLFVILSDEGTKHVEEMKIQKKVSCAIALETKVIGRIRGIQLTGIIEELEGDELKRARIAYLKAFPYAILMKTIVWGIKPNMMKMTDNRLGFGKKIIWKPDVENY